MSSCRNHVTSTLTVVLLLQTGIRLITTLTNFWPEFGGMGWYVDSILGAGNAPELFYSDPRVIAAFQTWVCSRAHGNVEAR